MQWGTELGSGLNSFSPTFLPQDIQHGLPTSCSPLQTSPAWVLYMSYSSSGIECSKEGFPREPAAMWVPPWLHREVCSSIWVAGRLPSPQWASPGLQGVAAPCLDLLLPSFLGACRAVSLISHSSLSCCCAAVFFLESALQEHIQHHSWLSSGRNRSLLDLPFWKFKKCFDVVLRNMV